MRTDQSMRPFCDQFKQPSTYSKNSFGDCCAFCGEPELLTKPHPILKKAKHQVRRHSHLSVANFAKGWSNKMAEAFGRRLSLNEVHQYSCLFVFICGSMSYQ